MKLVRALKIDRHTLRRRMDDLSIRCDYSTIKDAALDTLIKSYKVKKPDAGFRYVRGHLRSLGIRIQKQCVLNALQRVDRIGRLIRRRAVIQRQRYFTSRPNALWHCDGHHKLIKYGFVIHGFIDGNCRTVCCTVMFLSMYLIPTDHSPSCEYQQPRNHCSRTLFVCHSYIWYTIPGPW